MKRFQTLVNEDKLLLEMSQEIENLPKESTEQAKELFLKIFDKNHLTHLSGDNTKTI